MSNRVVLQRAMSAQADYVLPKSSPFNQLVNIVRDLGARRAHRGMEQAMGDAYRSMLYSHQHKAHALLVSRCVGLALGFNYGAILAHWPPGASSSVATSRHDASNNSHR
jgi:hypothetical protein